MSKNYWRLRDRSLCYIKYAYLDVKEHLADQLFINRAVRVHFGPEYAKPGEPYTIVFCKIKKRDEGRFLAALAELESKMLLLGHADYPSYCQRMMDAGSLDAAGPDS